MWFKPPQSGSKPHTSSTGPSAISSFRSLTGTSPTTYCHCRWGFDKVGLWPRAMQSPSQAKVLLFDLSLVWFATQLCLIGLNLTLSLRIPVSDFPSRWEMPCSFFWVWCEFCHVVKHQLTPLFPSFSPVRWDPIIIFWHYHLPLWGECFLGHESIFMFKTPNIQEHLLPDTSIGFRESILFAMPFDTSLFYTRSYTQFLSPGFSIHLSIFRK